MKHLRTLIVCLFLLLTPTRTARALTVEWIYGPNMRALSLTAPDTYHTLTTGLSNASTLLASLLTTPVSLTLTADALPLTGGILGAAGPSTAAVPYSSLLGRLPGLSDTAPTFDTTGSNVAVDTSRVWVTSANARALGLSVAETFSSDGNILLNTAVPWDATQQDGISSGSFDLTGVVLHELGHNLGVLSIGDSVIPNVTGTVSPYLMDYFRYSAPGVLSLAPDSSPKYFSTNFGLTDADGGDIDLVFANAPSASHWDGRAPRLMNPIFAASTLIDPTDADLLLLESLGYTTARTNTNVGADEPPAIYLLCFFVLLLYIYYVRRGQWKRGIM